jgi:hypothetical protein
MASHLDTCSFCSGPIDADSGTLGARVAICHSCTNRAAEQLAHDRTRESGLDACCSFCYVRTSTDSALVASDDRYICVECIALIKREFLTAPVQETAQTKGVLRLARNSPPNKSLERTREG